MNIFFYFDVVLFYLSVSLNIVVSSILCWCSYFHGLHLLFYYNEHTNPTNIWSCQLITSYSNLFHQHHSENIWLFFMNNNNNNNDKTKSAITTKCHHKIFTAGNFDWTDPLRHSAAYGSLDTLTSHVTPEAVTLGAAWQVEKKT